MYDCLMSLEYIFVWNRDLATADRNCGANLLHSRCLCGNVGRLLISVVLCFQLVSVWNPFIFWFHLILDLRTEFLSVSFRVEPIRHLEGFIVNQSTYFQHSLPQEMFLFVNVTSLFSPTPCFESGLVNYTSLGSFLLSFSIKMVLSPFMGVTLGFTDDDQNILRPPSSSIITLYPCISMNF